MDILIVTSRPEQWAPVLPVMEGRGAAVRQAGSLEQGMELVRQQAPALAVLDLGLEPEELRKAVIDILMVNAMIHTAAVSPMTAAEFHDKMEGARHADVPARGLYGPGRGKDDDGSGRPRRIETC